MRHINCWVYAFLEPISHEVRYIGCAGNPYERLKTHMCGSQINNPLLAAWITALRKRAAMPGVLILEEIPASRLRERGERERHWVETYHNAGAKLFNKQLNPDWVPPNAGKENMKSSAAKIRAALNALGWDASATDVVKWVGPVVHYFNNRNCKWNGVRWEVTGRRKYLLPESYVSAIRRQGPREQKMAEGT